jgi:creatinine amidohydrolase
MPMRKLAALMFCLATCLPAAAQSRDQVDMELMTYAEIADAMRGGKTTVLVYNGGTEQRGPHAVVGGHSLVARRASVEIARKLGNALVAPVLPFSIAGSHLNPKWPGSVNLSGQIFSALNEAVVDSMVVNGFKAIILMGDHGGGQRELQALAAKLDTKYATKGTRVFFCGDVYEKAQREADAYIAAHNLPAGSHASVRDTSILMYLGGDAYVRRDKLVAGNVNNGITGDPRPSTPELGKLFFDMQVNDAVAEINRLVKPSTLSRP